MSRLPIRLRLTAAFAFATAAVLALAGVFVFISVSHQLNDSIDETLVSRIDALIREVTLTPASQIKLGSSEDPEDSYSQIIRSDGTLLGSTSPSLTRPVLDGQALDRVAEDETGFDVGELPGVDGDSRLLARPAERDNETFVVVAGAATQDRDSTLSGLVRTFLITAPLALILASLAGYGLATVAMRPVERMRKQAGRITLERTSERLPLPDSRDEIFRLGSTLNEMLDRIEESLDRERSFVADASHELRTPLAIVRAELELGLRPDRDLTSARAAMLSAQEEVTRLEELSEDLLALERSDDRQRAIDRIPVSLPDLLESVRARIEPVADDADRELVVSAIGPPDAWLDRSRIERALDNLVNNALRHGSGRVSLSSRSGNGVVVFEVTDEGAGFPDGFGDEAFERFARADAGRTAGGHGLGLAIVKAIAETHGGTVSIEPVASGTAVVMAIPDAERSA